MQYPGRVAHQSFDGKLTFTRVQRYVIPAAVWIKVEIYIEDAEKKQGYEQAEGKYSVCAFLSQFFNKTLNFLRRGYTQISLMGTLIFPGGPSFPRPLVCPTLIQLAAL